MPQGNLTSTAADCVSRKLWAFSVARRPLTASAALAQDWPSATNMTKRLPNHSKRSSTSLRSSPLAAHPSRAERYAQGRRLRDNCPRSSHAAWQPSASRPDALAVVLKAEKGRLPELLPLRHGR